MNESALDHSWMTEALAFLFDECGDQEVRDAVGSDESLHRLQNRSPVDFGNTNGTIGLAGQATTRDNLWRGLIALRLKFSRAEAEQKLARNIEIRSQDR